MSIEVSTEGLPAPEPTQRFNGAHRRLGAPISDFVYRDGWGRVIMHVCRYKLKSDPTAPSESDDEIATRWWAWSSDLHEWREHRAVPESAPLYQFDLLFQKPSFPVYLVDSEESADALQRILNGANSKAIATCWPGGLSKYRQADFRVLEGRDVTLWPSFSPQAQTNMLAVGGKIFSLVSPKNELGIIRDTGKPARWDVAAAIDGGWDWDSIQEYVIGHVFPITEAPRNFTVPLESPPRVDVHVEIREEPVRQKVNMTLAEKWRAYDLATASNGLPHPNLYNVVKVIEFHKGGYCDVWLDEFHNKLMTQPSGAKSPREWTDADTLEFTRFIQSPSGVGLSKLSTHIVHDAVVLYGSKRKRNEVREWLDGLVWDGTERLEQVLQLAWGTDDNTYYRAVGRCFIMGAVKRIYEPGCQVDNLPVFEGPEGIGKTTAIMKLASEQWFDSPTYALGDHDFYQSLPGKWFIEFGEMANMQGRTLEAVYAAISRRRDTYRPSYGRVSVTFPRMCVFSATTNKKQWNKSTTGARRYWPVTCGKIDCGVIQDLREQWFAEARVRIERGEKWYDVPTSDALAEQRLREEEDIWKDTISVYLEGQQEVSSEQILVHCLGIVDRTRWDVKVKTRLSNVMRQLNWEQVVTTREKKSSRVWRDASRPRTPARSVNDPPRD